MYDGDAPFETDVHKSKLRKILRCSTWSKLFAYQMLILFFPHFLSFQGMHWRPIGIRIHIWRSHANKNVAHGGEGTSWDDTAECCRHAHASIAIRSRNAGATLEKYHPSRHHQLNIKLSSRECVIWVQSRDMMSWWISCRSALVALNHRNPSKILWTP